jgi:hypothetical protein
MFGDPLKQLANMSAKGEKRQFSPQEQKLIEEVVQYIHANLRNIRNVWGVGSEQYESAASILDQYLESKLQQLKVDKEDVDIDALLQKMSLDDQAQTTSKSSQAKS